MHDLWERQAERRAKILTRAGERGLNGIVVFGHGSGLSYGDASHGALRYLTGWDGVHFWALALMSRDGDVDLLTPNFFQTFVPGAIDPSLRAHHAQTPETVTGAVQSLCRGAWGGIGLEHAPAWLSRAVGAGLPGEPQDLTPDLDRQRMVKDAAEIAAHRKAAELSDRLMESLVPALSTQEPGWKTQRRLEHDAVLNGADHCQTWLTIAAKADYPRYYRTECEAAPKAGDQVLFGTALTVDGCYGHAIRMGVVGEPAERDLRFHNTVCAMQQSAFDAARTGARLTDLQSASDRVFQSGFPEIDVDAPLQFRLAHGLGHSYDEAAVSQSFRHPYDKVASASLADTPVETGMLFELHPNFFIPGEGGAAIGDMVLITERGARIPYPGPQRSFRGAGLEHPALAPRSVAVSG